MSQLEIREATLADVTALHTLVESAYRGEVSKQGWTTEADFLEGQRTDPQDLAQIIGDHDQCIMLGMRDGNLLASLNLKRADQGAWLGMFAVSPRAQGQGIGRAMVAAAERKALSWGADQVRMHVISIRESLIAWYQRLGYQVSGERAPFPYGNERFGIPKRHDLEFLVLSKRIGSTE